ncbi:MAG: PRC-barrel domain-containing protein [Candidatus Methanospirareceae archaeon]
MWWKRREREGKEKVVAYLRSKVFPWNFIFEDVTEDALEHFVPYAIQMCEAKGIEKGAIGVEEVKAVIRREVREAVNDYLFDPGDKEMIRMHGKFAPIYPFAFSQSLAYVILYRLGLKLEEIVDVKGICDLLGKDVMEVRRRESLIQEIIARGEDKAMKMFARSILDKRVITAGGDCIGTVKDIIFADETGELEGLVVNHKRGSGLKKSRISMGDVSLNMYSKNIFLKSSNYHK